MTNATSTSNAPPAYSMHKKDPLNPEYSENFEIPSMVLELFSYSLGFEYHKQLGDAVEAWKTGVKPSPNPDRVSIKEHLSINGEKYTEREKALLSSLDLLHYIISYGYKLKGIEEFKKKHNVNATIYLNKSLTSWQRSFDINHESCEETLDYLGKSNKRLKNIEAANSFFEQRDLVKKKLAQL